MHEPSPHGGFDGVNIFSKTFKDMLNIHDAELAEWRAIKQLLYERLGMQVPYPMIPGEGGTVSSVLCGRITSVAGDGVGGLVSYSAESVDGQFIVTAVEPAWKPFGSADVIPASIGDPCILIRFKPTLESPPETRLWAVPEQASWGGCADEPTPAFDETVKGSVKKSAMEENGYTTQEMIDFLATR